MSWINLTLHWNSKRIWVNTDYVMYVKEGDDDKTIILLDNGQQLEVKQTLTDVVANITQE